MWSLMFRQVTLLEGDSAHNEHTSPECDKNQKKQDIPTAPLLGDALLRVVGALQTTVPSGY
jgi:hypothetical protein